MSSDEVAHGATSYAFKPSLAGAARRFDLTEAGLAWQVGARRGLWPYAAIAAVQLSYRPVSMQPRQFRADIVGGDGQRQVVLSTSWKGFALVETQDEAYRRFILELHRRIAAAGDRAAFHGGMRPIPYALAAGVLGLVAMVMAALVARALATDAWAGALFLLALGAVFVWQIGGFMRRNKPCRYTADALPPQLLP
ncbi:MAG: hypothetical protein M9932_10720 [Xanthobacteraceae bacterium]|nr:hypothetical protein [Xanthobacteraceae bacterium]